MSETPADFEAMLSALEESSRWAKLHVTYNEIKTEAKKVAKDMEKYSLDSTLPILAGLLTLPKYQSNCLRLELLIALAALCCSGKKKANIGQAVRWFKEIGKTRLAMGEDPSEDVFVTNTHDDEGNYLLLEGIWEASGFHTQLFIDVIATMPEHGNFVQIRRSFQALLKISNEICQRSSLSRYMSGNDQVERVLTPSQIPAKNNLVQRVTFSSADMAALNITKQDISPFIVTSVNREKTLRQSPGLSFFEYRPILQNGPDNYIVAMPSALSIAARNFIIGMVIFNDLTDAFDERLAAIYAKTIYRTPLLGRNSKVPVQWNLIDGTRYAACSGRIDEGYFLIYVFCLNTIKIHQDGWFKIPLQSTEEVSNELRALIDHSIKEMTTAHINDFKEGLVLFVGCDWGKGFQAEVYFDHVNWKFEHIPASDLIRVSWLHGISPEYFMRIQYALDAAQKAGVTMANVSGVMNAIGWIKRNKGHVIPHQTFLDVDTGDGVPMFLEVGQNLHRDVRIETDQDRDLHRIKDHEGKWLLVQKENIGGYFKSPARERLYMSFEDVDVMASKILGVQNDNPTIWITVTAPSFQNRRIIFGMWEVAREWLPRISEYLNANLTYASDIPPLMLNLIFEGEGEYQTLPNEPLDYAALLKLVAIQSNTNASNETKIIFRDGFLYGFNNPDNTAERVIVEYMIRAILAHVQQTKSDKKIESLVSNIVKNREARAFHLFYGRDYLHYVEDSLPDCMIELDEIDDAIVKLGMAQKVTHNRKIKGVHDCTRLLNEVVEVLLKELCDELSAYNREQTLTKTYYNIAKANAHQDRWRRTSAAILGLNKDLPKIYQQYVKETSKYAAASGTCRILAEICVCACSLEGGETLSNLELSQFMAKASLVYRLGGLSDAIRYNALTPEIHVSPYGDMLFRNDFGDFVVEPFLNTIAKEHLQSIAPEQHKNYKEPALIEKAGNKFQDEFLLAWQEEFGFSVDDARSIITLSENIGMEKQRAVYEIKRSEFIHACIENDSENLTEKTVSSFLEAFSLASRKIWKSPPSGYDLRDIYPWTFGRRLSLTARPILQINQDSDPTLIVAPHNMRTGFAYVFDGAYNAKLPQGFFQTKNMRDAWWVKASSGHEHAQNVAEALKKEGWNVRIEISLPQILNQKISSDIGDVDVLAWRGGVTDVWVIECKDLRQPRNYSEIAHMLSEFQGKDKNGKPDKLRRHLKRVEKLRGKSGAVRKFCQIDAPEIQSALIFSNPVPMQYAKIDALNDTFVGVVEGLIAHMAKNRP